LFYRRFFGGVNEKVSTAIDLSERRLFRTTHRGLYAGKP
jgi:hypothetical protein